MSSDSSRDKTGPSNTDEGGESNRNNDDVNRALEEMDLCQNEIDVLNEQAINQLCRATLHFNRLRTPCWKKRSEIIKKIPHFWLAVFTHHPKLSSFLRGYEKSWFSYLKDVDVEDNDDIKSGYRINFYFYKNPYFKDRVLTKEFDFSIKQDPLSCSTAIRWKREFHALRYLEGNDTFYTWFTDHWGPRTDEMADIIRHVWLNPMRYYAAIEDASISEYENGESSDESDSANDKTESAMDETVPVHYGTGDTNAGEESTTDENMSEDTSSAANKHDDTSNA